MDDDQMNLGGDDEDTSKEAAKKPAKTKALGIPKLVSMTLDPHESIPPTGQFVGLNGKGYLIRPGEKVSVPAGVVEILDNAIETKDIQDPVTLKTIGSRDQRRFSFRTHG